METVKALIEKVKEECNQEAVSKKDEVKVMQAMLNDTSYEVGIYGKDGQEDVYNPAKDFKKMQTNIIASALNINKKEAETVMETYEVTTSDAASMVNIGKEFINTYLNTGRKIALGAREDSNFALTKKVVPERSKKYIKRTVTESGDTITEQLEKIIPEHAGLKVRSACPSWITMN